MGYILAIVMLPVNVGAQVQFFNVPVVDQETCSKMHDYLLGRRYVSDEGVSYEIVSQCEPMTAQPQSAE